MEISNTPEGLLRSSHPLSPSRVDTAPCDIARVRKAIRSTTKFRWGQSSQPTLLVLQYCGDLGKTSKSCEQGKVCFPILLRLAKWRCPGGKQWKQTDAVLQAASQAPFNLLFNYFQSRKISVSFTKISYVAIVFGQNMFIRMIKKNILDWCSIARL